MKYGLSSSLTDTENHGRRGPYNHFSMHKAVKDATEVKMEFPTVDDEDDEDDEKDDEKNKTIQKSHIAVAISHAVAAVAAVAAAAVAGILKFSGAG